MDIVSVDKVGRLVLPKGTRDRLRIDESTKLLVAEIKDDALLLKKLDLDEMKRQLSGDLEDVDLGELFRRARDETNEKVRKAYPEVFS